ncbi:MAG: hypothetical protein WB297_01590 [Actinomycetota bacterium]
MTPAEREQRRLAANERWSKQDPGPFMERVREGLIQKWRLQVITEAQGVKLPEAEIARRIDAKRRAHQNRMTLAAMAARKARGPAA